MGVLTEQTAQEPSRVNIGVAAQERMRLHRPPKLVLERPSAPALPLGLMARQLDGAETQKDVDGARVAGWVKRARKTPHRHETVADLILRSLKAEL